MLNLTAEGVRVVARGLKSSEALRKKRVGECAVSGHRDVVNLPYNPGYRYFAGRDPSGGAVMSSAPRAKCNYCGSTFPRKFTTEERAMYERFVNAPKQMVTI